MARSGRIPVILATALFARFEAAPCDAQAPKSSPADSSLRLIAGSQPPVQARQLPAQPPPAQPGPGSTTTTAAALGPASSRIDRSLPQALPLPPADPIRRPAGDDLGVKLQPAPLEPSDIPLPINLATALRLSDARPLIVAAAQAGVWVAEAQLTRAKVLWIPRLNIGFDYIRHDGGGPDFNKGIMTAPSVNF